MFTIKKVSATPRHLKHKSKRLCGYSIIKLGDLPEKQYLTEI